MAQRLSVDVHTRALRAAARNNGDSELQGGLQHGESEVVETWWRRVLSFIGRPHVMTTERAKEQGVFLPNWWIGILLVPVIGAVMWVVMTMVRIDTNVANLDRTIQSDVRELKTEIKILKIENQELAKEFAEFKGTQKPRGDN